MPFDKQVNGVHVVSSYDYESIENGRVNFTNGSWCDVTTRTFKNTGNGTIRMGDLVSPGPHGDLTGTAADLTTRQETFLVRSLDIAVKTAVIEIERYQDKGAHEETTVTITGHKDLVSGVTVRELNNRLYITEVGEGVGGTIVIQTSNPLVRAWRHFTGFFKRGKMVVDHPVSDDEPAIRIHARIPDGTPLNLNTGNGDTVVDDTYGELTLNVEGTGSVQVGRITDLKLKSNASGDTTIREMQGYDASIDITGSGDVTIKRGAIFKLEVICRASGKAVLDITAHHAKLANRASGSIFVSHVNEEPEIDRQGIGDIIVRRTG